MWPDKDGSDRSRKPESHNLFLDSGTVLMRLRLQPYCKASQTGTNELTLNCVI
jgi:hypothetical protein